MTSLLRTIAAMTAMSTLAIAIPVLASPLNPSVGLDTKQRSSVLENFGDVRGVGEFIVLRDSYRSYSQTVRQFEAIVDGTREIWWADCQGNQLRTDRWSAPRNSSTAEIITFVCNDRYIAGNHSSVVGSMGGSPYRGSSARVLQQTDALSSNGRVVFSFFEGEQIQLNWSDRRSFNGREYVAATDSVGQRGYIRTDRIQSYGAIGGGRPTGITGRPIRTGGTASERVVVLRETPGVSSNGRELFYFFEGEQIRVNWGDRRSINGREYVAATDSVGQQGYIRVDQLGRTRSGSVTTHPSREQWRWATVSRETPGLSESGQELFFFYEGEQIQINRNAVLRIGGRDHVEALDSVGQRGYIRVDRVR